MKTPQPTKEQLSVELGKIRQSHADWVVSDERRRKEFAKAFNWVQNVEMDLYKNHATKEPQLPSWEQIFVHIGRLLVAQESQMQAKEIMGLLTKSFPIPPIKML